MQGGRPLSCGNSGRRGVAMEIRREFAARPKCRKLEPSDPCAWRDRPIGPVIRRSDDVDSELFAAAPHREGKGDVG